MTNLVATIPQARVPAEFLRPYAKNSPWNTCRAGAVLTDIGLSASPMGWDPMVRGAVPVFRADGRNKPRTISAPQGRITIPHWPAATTPDPSSDGHCDIIDTLLGVVHSFWMLRKEGKDWTCGYYGQVPLNGSGWGDGARASGCPASAGIIRLHELPDDAGPIPHALSMSLMHADLTAAPKGFVSPANRSDSDDGTPNTGRIPQGALMMLPANFDTSSLQTQFLRRVAQCLKDFGAFVTDRNVGTPYIIYTEGSSFNAFNLGWDALQDMHAIRRALRMVESVATRPDARTEKAR